MNYERITKDKQFDSVRDVHEYRYRLIGEHIKEQDNVVDFGCGIGYGKQFVSGKYIGVDKLDLCENIVADLNTWKPDFEYDVAVSFETIEHLQDYTQLVQNLKNAKRLIALSTPIIETKHRNEYHLHDFTVEYIESLFEGLKIVHKEIQNNIYGVWIWEK